MAEKKDLDLDAAKKTSGKKQLFLYLLIGVLLVAVSVTSTLLYTGRTVEVVKEKAVKEALYLPLDTMVVNFGGRSVARYLQVDIQLMTHEQQVIDAVNANMPIIRNDLLLLLSNQSSDTISTLEGKARLRAEILEAIQKVLTEQAAARNEILPGTVEAVYFTSFVMQ